MINAVPLLFSLDCYDYLAGQILAQTGYEAGVVEVNTFPDGERYQRVMTPVQDRDVVFLGATFTDELTLRMYDLACSMVARGARSMTLILPYYAYSTMERATKEGEVVTAKTRARLLSSIPVAPEGNRVILIDLHSEGIPHYFEGQVIPVHLHARQVILDACREIGGDKFVMACTDAGRAKWVESLANDLGTTAAFVFKRRIDGKTTEVTAMNAAVAGQRVVIYDDMIRTGGSLIQAAQAYKGAGASSVVGIATHGILPGGALERIHKSGLFDTLLCTDTHPRVKELEGDFMVVRSVGGMLIDYLKKHFV